MCAAGPNAGIAVSGLLGGVSAVLPRGVSAVLPGGVSAVLPRGGGADLGHPAWHMHVACGVESLMSVALGTSSGMTAQKAPGTAGEDLSCLASG